MMVRWAPGGAFFVLAIVSALLCALPAFAAKGTKVVHVQIIVPASYSSNVTPDQAVAFARTVTGATADAPCPAGSRDCSVESWLRREVGDVFEYDVTVYRISAGAAQLSSSFDSCGRMSDSTLYARVYYYLNAEFGYKATSSNRTMTLVLGAGGWAGHLWASPSNTKYDAFGLVGDWGVEEMFGVPNPCIPDWDYPGRGYGHEFAGMMGMFYNGSYSTDDPVFTGDVLNATQKAQLLKTSGGWLHQ